MNENTAVQFRCMKCGNTQVKVVFDNASDQLSCTCTVCTYAWKEITYENSLLNIRRFCEMVKDDK